jgi:hypothetical protein
VEAVATAAILVILWKQGVEDPAYIVQIHFGMAPQALAGAEVMIDSEVVGTLEEHDNRFVSGFRVEEGDHIAELRLPGCASEQARFTSGFGGANVLLVWYQDLRVQGADTVCVLRSQR